MSGLNQVLTTFFSIIGGNKCKTERIGITMTEEKWNQSLSDKESTYFKTLESKMLMAVSLSRLRSQLLRLLLQRPVNSMCAPSINLSSMLSFTCPTWLEQNMRAMY